MMSFELATCDPVFRKPDCRKSMILVPGPLYRCVLIQKLAKRGAGACSHCVTWRGAHEAAVIQVKAIECRHDWPWQGSHYRESSTWIPRNISS